MKYIVLILLIVALLWIASIAWANRRSKSPYDGGSGSGGDSGGSSSSSCNGSDGGCGGGDGGGGGGD
ncbi:MAG: hypothetical protein A3F73_09465 [Gallionellales bacterium RIFCSPLOWO2_12_FULL_59_22]|nr:MAG: hypothetical protein A3H99_13000 [Gallionellales bacterium RIFCSPLOWO2_02_FULL_59_110]OGT14637.1 MAG: hypothetical protein A3F73_09465 [Gallionellales bacterium RIFCSPLOWO2_12_FULL_59_22]